MARRRAHLVGSIPAATAEDGMRLAAGRLGPDLDFLPDGETGERRNWTNHMIDRLRRHPDVRLARDGDRSGYDSLPRFALRPGRRLYGASLDLGIAEAVADALPAWRALRAAGQAPPRFQVGIPGDQELALAAFGPSGPFRQARAFAEALAAAMHRAHELLDGDVLFQVEVPLETVLLGRVPSVIRPPLAGLMARRIAALALGAPEGSWFGVHLCLGDMNHRALGAPGDASALVALANAVAGSWPGDRRLAYLHLPLAAADRPPSGDAAFYAPLAGLRLGRDTRLIAGFAHEGQDLAAQLRIRQVIEDCAGYPVGISASCGLGRRDEPAALAVMDRIEALLA